MTQLPPSDLPPAIEAAPPGAAPGREQLELPWPPGRGALRTIAAALLVFAAALLLYALTAAPEVGFGEAARLQAAAHDLDLGAGAADHPLTVAAAWALQRIPPRIPPPFGWEASPARRANLASALAAALAVSAVFLIALALLDATSGGPPRGRVVFAAAGAACLAVAHPFWAAATIADSTALDTLLLALVTWLWVLRLARGAGAWAIYLGALLLGLAITNQRAVAFVAPVYLVTGIAALRAPGRRNAAAAMRGVLIAFAIGLVPLLVLAARDVIEARAAAAGARGLGSATALVWRRTAGEIAPLLPPHEALLLLGLRISAAFLAATALAVLGVAALAVRGGARRPGLLLLAVASAAAAGSLVVRSTIPLTWIPIAVWVAVGAAVVGRRGGAGAALAFALLLIGIPIAFDLALPRLSARRELAPWIEAAVLVPSAGPGTPLHPWRAGDTSARRAIETIRTAMPPGAVLVASPLLASSFRYLTEVEGDSLGPTPVVTAPLDPDSLGPFLAAQLASGRRVRVATPGFDAGAVAAARRRVWLGPEASGDDATSGLLLRAEPQPPELEAAERAFEAGRWWEAAHFYGAALGDGGAAGAGDSTLARWAAALERSGFPELAARVRSELGGAGAAGAGAGAGAAGAGAGAPADSSAPPPSPQDDAAGGS